MACEDPTQRRLGLLNMPPELRVAIYEYVLFEEHPIHIKCSTKPRRVNISEGLEFWAVVDLYDIVLPSLARTSCQVRNESLTVFFETNTFVFETPLPTESRNNMRISNFNTFCKFVEKIEMKKFVSNYRRIRVTLDFNAGQHGPTVTIKPWQGGDNSTESTKRLWRRSFPDCVPKLIEDAFSKQISEDTDKEDIIRRLLQARIALGGQQEIKLIL